MPLAASRRLTTVTINSYLPSNQKLVSPKKIEHEIRVFTTTEKENDDRAASARAATKGDVQAG